MKGIALQPRVARRPIGGTPRPSADAGDRSLGRRLVDAMVAWDEPVLRDLLADDVWLRALLVRDVIERHDAAGAMQVLYGWYGSAYETRLVRVEADQVVNRERILHRVRLRPAWEPATWHVIEQTGYLRAVDGRVGRLDLTCTGFHPEA